MPTGLTASNHVFHVASLTCARRTSAHAIHSCSAFVTSGSVSPATCSSTSCSTPVDKRTGPLGPIHTDNATAAASGKKDHPPTHPSAMGVGPYHPSSGDARGPVDMALTRAFASPKRPVAGAGAEPLPWPADRSSGVGPGRGATGEAHLPAEHTQAGQATRLPAPHGDAGRARHPQGSPAQGPP